MFLKKCIKNFFLIFILSSSSFAEINIKTVVSINNDIITNIDLENEIQILKIINKNKNLDIKKTEPIALKTLIEEKIKKQEIIKNKIILKKDTVEQFFLIFLNNNQLNIEKLNTKEINLLKEKIEINLKWQNLINKKFGWRININMNEIETKIARIQKEKKININLFTLRDELIKEEKNKKLNVFSNYYYEKIKKKSLINYYYD